MKDEAMKRKLNSEVMKQVNRMESKNLNSIEPGLQYVNMRKVTIKEKEKTDTEKCRTKRERRREIEAVKKTDLNTSKISKEKLILKTKPKMGEFKNKTNISFFRPAAGFVMGVVKSCQEIPMGKTELCSYSDKQCHLPGGEKVEPNVLVKEKRKD